MATGYMDDGTESSHRAFMKLLSNLPHCGKHNGSTVFVAPTQLVSPSQPKAAVLDHCKSSVLAHLEVHASYLPRKGRHATSLPHRHHDEEVILMLGGAASLTANGPVATRGDLIYHPPQADHRIVASPMEGSSMVRESQYLAIRWTLVSRVQSLLEEGSLLRMPGDTSQFVEWSEPPASTVFRGGCRQTLLHRPTQWGSVQVHSTCLAPGKAGTNIHTDPHDVMIVVLRGTLQALPGGTLLPAGSVTYFASHSRHGVRNADNSTTSVHLAFEFLT
eukprot:CAMPEP_0119309612 /NCGR_PEP_ID=MMETSP1333-20130426/15863_1 /TAXON_ID=418940 /ORGANISM="Scyphosphaera apsteinii, Strain RCC1455" /LENGTH=274 /DNA_ID=CAMNT_0007313611 /DNA_START=71 /DNA_END=895 /DNA_ORIENTATION=+